MSPRTLSTRIRMDFGNVIPTFSVLSNLLVPVILVPRDPLAINLSIIMLQNNNPHKTSVTLPLPAVLQWLYRYDWINPHIMDELSNLEERIQDKIIQTKIKMDKTMERAETDRLWPIIETLNWVLNEMLEVSGTNQRKTL
jgi:hypothetical protein